MCTNMDVHRTRVLQHTTIHITMEEDVYTTTAHKDSTTAQSNNNYMYAQREQLHQPYVTNH